MKTLIGLRQKRGSVLRIPTVEQRREWDQASVTGKLPRDLHPQIRRLVEFQRAVAKSHPENMHPDALRRVLEQSR